MLRLTRSTFCGREVVYAEGLDDAAGRVLDVRSSECVFEGASVLAHPERLRRKLPDVMSWIDDGDIFAVRRYVTPRWLPPRVRLPPADLRDWHDLWGQKENRSRPAKAMLGPEMGPQAGKAHGRLTPEDFRIEDANAGADVDWLGPGGPYDRWRKTAEYKEWLRKTQRAIEPR